MLINIKQTFVKCYIHFCSMCWQISLSDIQNGMVSILLFIECILIVRHLPSDIISLITNCETFTMGISLKISIVAHHCAGKDNVVKDLMKF